MKLGARYELHDELGRGGMGVVWRATDQRLGRQVAVKVLHPWIAEDGDLRDRFEREAAALAQLTHPHIVRLYDFEQSGDQAFLVMELVEGKSLAALLQEESEPLTWGRARTLLAQAAEALEHTHERGIAHRDLTPTNILVEHGKGRVVVTDFGLARIARSARSLTATGVLIGTPEYWAPEQALGKASTAAVDVYAIGCILFEALSGRRPFEGDDRLAVGLRRAHEDAPSLATFVPNAPLEAVTLVRAALERLPDRRPATKDIVTALRAYAKTAPPTSADDEVTVRDAASPADLALRVAGSPSRRRRKLAGAAIVVCALGATGWALLAADLREKPAKASPPPTLKVPRFVGVSVAQAQKRLGNATRRAGVGPQRLQVVERVYSERFRRGIIVSQSPRPRSLHPREHVPLLKVRLSLGTAWVAVPSATGLSYSGANRRFAALDLDVERVDQSSWTAPEGTVLAQSPSPRERLRRPATVRLRVSSGPPTINVPRVLEQSVSEATRVLTNAGLKVIIRTRQTTAPEHDGAVVSTEPSWGSDVRVGTYVIVVVGNTPRWRVVYRFSGDAARNSGRLRVSSTWRIRYSIVGVLATAIVSWRAEDGFEQVEQISSYTDGGAGVIDPGAGPGTYTIGVEPAERARWSVIVETFE